MIGPVPWYARPAKREAGSLPPLSSVPFGGLVAVLPYIFTSLAYSLLRQRRAGNHQQAHATQAQP